MCRLLIGALKDTDLTLIEGPDAKLQKLRQHIERVTTSEKDKEWLRELFDVKVCDLLTAVVQKLPSEFELHKRGLRPRDIAGIKTNVRVVLDGIQHLPLFYDVNYERLTASVRRLLEEKNLIKPLSPER